MEKIKFFPVAFFSMIMGLGGFTIAVHKAEEILQFNHITSLILLGLTSLIFIILFISYLIKISLHFEYVKKEFYHPIKLNFFPTFSISLLVLSAAFLSIDLPYHLNHLIISKILWIIGTVLHLIFTLYIISIWIHHTHFEIHHINPAWFIPVVGNILIPIAGTTHASIEISWFFFSIGLLYWLILFTIIFYRVLFHHPLPEKLLPTLFILLAPPSVGFLSYLNLTNATELDQFAKILFYNALFLGLLLLVQIPRFVKIPFFLSWWTYSFPVAALTIASFSFYTFINNLFSKIIAFTLIILLFLIILILLFKTIEALLKQTILVED